MTDLHRSLREKKVTANSVSNTQFSQATNSMIFPVGDINRLRRRAQLAATQPPSDTYGWTISAVDPMDILAVFTTLRIKPGFTLHAYEYNEGGNGNGVVWAMPRGLPLPPPDDCPRIEEAFLSPPKPERALDDVMQAIEGDGSPFSYMSASVLARELGEFGARWHGISWGRNRIVDRKPLHRGLGRVPRDVESQWTWNEPVPKQWRPQTEQTGDGISVRFYLYDDIGIERLIEVTDSFKSGSYAFSAESKEIAFGGPGIIF